MQRGQWEILQDSAVPGLKWVLLTCNDGVQVCITESSVADLLALIEESGLSWELKEPDALPHV